MIKVENVETMGWEATIRGMRNPMNSWDKSDSFVCREEGNYDCPKCAHIGRCPVQNDDSFYAVGKNDLDLMKRLAKGGPVHAKYRRMITVYMDITAPLYWWKEFDTYKVGTVANSCSTMHKIHAKEFELDDFSHEHLINVTKPNSELINNDCVPFEVDDNLYWTATNILELTVEALNKYRHRYLETKDKRYWWQMIQLLPTSYNQRRTVMLNYEVLNNIYHSRKDHKLDEWREFCDTIKTLPLSEIIIGEEQKNDKS